MEDTLRPKLDWRTLLWRFATEALERAAEASWSRQNRRLLGTGLYLPSHAFNPTLGRISAGLDTSGSIGDRELSIFINELSGIKEECCPALMDLIWADAAVARHQVFSRYEDLDPKPAGGGGTAFGETMDLVRDLDPRADAMIYFTDLCTSDFGEDPGCPVLWIVVGEKGNVDSQAALQKLVPFGQVTAFCGE